MARKRLVLLALPVVVAFAAAGIAIAATSSGAQAASATFAATTVSNSKVVSCSVNGGDTLASTVATYKGTASSADDRLAGDITIRARSLVDTTTGLGRVVGVFRISSGNGNTAHGKIDAAFASGAASGLVTGRVRDPGGRLVLTLSSPFDPSSGFQSGSKLGTGSVAGAGVVLSGGCNAGNAHAQQLRWLHREMRHLRKEIHRIRKG
jgi:hypothetical protein